VQPDTPERKPFEYPTNRLVGILETEAQTNCAVDALVRGGFLESDIRLGRGPEDAAHLEGATGRRGFRDWLLRVFESAGVTNIEIEVKDRYEQALRDGYTVLGVPAPTEERKDRAAEILRGCGGSFINFFGRLSVERVGY
jgi:hypothetical protein